MIDKASPLDRLRDMKAILDSPDTPHRDKVVRLMPWARLVDETIGDLIAVAEAADYLESTPRPDYGASEEWIRADTRLRAALARLS